jgi:hypothetical protein
MLFQFDTKISDGQQNEIEGIFQSFEGQFSSLLFFQRIPVYSLKYKHNKEPIQKIQSTATNINSSGSPSRRSQALSTALFWVITQRVVIILISTFRRVVNVVCFLLGNSPASEFYMPTFRKTVVYIIIGGYGLFYPPMKMVPTVGSETLPYKIQTPGNYQKESIQ